jgi:TRAP-type C4-dicarboxylate transport system permease small subunit
MGLVYLSLPISGMLIIFYSFLNLLELLEQRKIDLNEVAESKETKTKVKVGDIV